MLADPRAKTLVSNFVGQWLYLRNIDAVLPDPSAFPDFDENLRAALARETELFFESMLREDRSLLDLLRADYTFVNERLARHYGISGIHGTEFRRVTLTNEERKGSAGERQRAHGDVVSEQNVADLCAENWSWRICSAPRLRRLRPTCRRSKKTRTSVF